MVSNSQIQKKYSEDLMSSKISKYSKQAL